MNKFKYVLILVCTVVFTMGQLKAQSVPELFWYKFDQSGTTVTNYATTPPAGAGAGTLMGGLTQGNTGQCGGALIGTEVSSNTDYVNTGWATNFPTRAWTLSFWTSDITPSSTLFYIFGDANANQFRIFTNGVAGASNWVLRGTGISDVFINGAATVAPSLSTFVYDSLAGNIKAYLNGSLVNTVAQSSFLITGPGPFKVGGYSTNVGLPLNGKLDEFRLYNRALTDTEVMELMYVHTDSVADISACDFYSSPSGNYTWTTSGTYQDTIDNVVGCDSVITFNLTVYNSSLASVTMDVCDSLVSPSGLYTWTSSGIYHDTIDNAAGCDSLITFNLTVYNSSLASVTMDVCDSLVSPSGLYTWTSSGIYHDTIDNAAGCDSLITFDLTVRHSSLASVTMDVCDSLISPSGLYTWTTSGIYYDTIPNLMGCDSLLTIDLTVNHTTLGHIEPVACFSYTSPSGLFQWTVSGNYNDTITNVAGCDSIISITLTIDTVNTGVTGVDFTLVADAPGATYQWVDCDNAYALIPGEVHQSFVPSVNGNYAVIITEGSCTDTSACNPVIGIGIQGTAGKVDLELIPNPNNGQFVIRTSEIQQLIEISDNAGQLIKRILPESNTVTADIRGMAAGVYYVKVTGRNGVSVLPLIINP